MPRLRVALLFVSLVLAAGCGGGFVGTGSSGGSAPPVNNNNPVTSTTIDGNTLITIQAKSNDLVWDSTHGVLYAAISHESPNYPGTLAAIDPLTGHVTPSVSLSQEPSVLALSDDDQFLYVGIDPTSPTASVGGYIQRYTSPGLTSDIQIPLGMIDSPPDAPWPSYPLALAVAPGLSHTLAVAAGAFRNYLLPGNWAQDNTAAVYDDEQARTKMINYGYPLEVNFLLWGADATTLYLGEETDPAELYTYSVDATGLTVGAFQPIAMAEGWTSPPLPLRVFRDKTTGYLYSSQGEVFDPASGKRVMGYSVDGTPYVAQWGIFYPDPVLNQVYFAGQTAGQFGACEPGTQPVACQGTIATLDKTTGAILHSVTFNTLFDSPVVITRWGSNGLAFCIGSVRLDGASRYSTKGLTFILQGPLVAP